MAHQAVVQTSMLKNNTLHQRPTKLKYQLLIAENNPSTNSATELFNYMQSYALVWAWPEHS